MYALPRVKQVVGTCGAVQGAQLGPCDDLERQGGEMGGKSEGDLYVCI